MVLPNNQQKARAGEALVVAELNRRGVYAVSFAGNMPAIDILASNMERSRTVQIQVKTRRSGSWQTKITEGRPSRENPHETAFWVFVDIASSIPLYYVCPDWWIRNDIHMNHQAYLQRHGGTRAKNPASLHHGITRKRIERWEGRWDILCLF